MIERIDPPMRRRAYGGEKINRVQDPWRTHSVHYITICLGSIFPFFIMADVMPVVPPLGFMLFLGWRLIRPGLMPLWAGVPLGAFDDLFSGQPFGSAIFLWSLTMIALEVIETRFPWRGFWLDWFTAGLGIVLYITAAMVVSGASISVHLVAVIGPQILISILLYPILARAIGRADRFRLSRARRIG
ncbi:rod shape-determining protein MreD [Erythrobacter sp. SCSIO 43205]|uniref:rod shape-determining protein MreD n=1 Tax=Erythrobacter sp. SCSIO 43205 TaxID=2779361 RepID=UPI001CAA0B42|nr:rod shape-determining protein MreD [Erythrobacter sp. SCSIO 43205]UAB77101.1 rod shape-determining protein MreD [Erythrobacter sp. SCSIO 43205]